MIQPPRRHCRTFNQTFHLQAGFLILTRVTHVNDWMTHCELEIFANVRVQAFDVNKLNCLIFACFIVKTHGFCSTTI